MKYLLLFLTCFFTSILYANNTSRDKAYLQELAARYEEATLQGDLETVLAALKPYLEEAVRQGDEKEERYARIENVYCYYNHIAYDLLFDEIERHMEYFKQKEWWEEYYICANLQIEALIFADKRASALHQAERRYAEAIRSKDPLAIRMTAYGLFYCYHYSGRNEEAARIYKEVTKDGMVLHSLKRFDELLQHTARFEAYIDQCDEENKQNGVVVNNAMYRFYIYCSYADA